jgi:hypothetical protein
MVSQLRGALDSLLARAISPGLLHRVADAVTAHVGNSALLSILSAQGITAAATAVAVTGAIAVPAADGTFELP